MHLSWMMLRKQGALNNQMLRLGCGLPPTIKIPGYVPAQRGTAPRSCIGPRAQVLNWTPHLLGPALSTGELIPF